MLMTLLDQQRLSNWSNLKFKTDLILVSFWAPKLVFSQVSFISFVFVSETTATIQCSLKLALWFQQSEKWGLMSATTYTVNYTKTCCSWVIGSVLLDVRISQCEYIPKGVMLQSCIRRRDTNSHVHMDATSRKSGRHWGLGWACPSKPTSTWRLSWFGPLRVN